MSNLPRYTNDQFIQTFNQINYGQSRYDTFKDFVSMSAFSLHNAVRPSESLESEYMTIVSKYSEDDRSRLVALFVMLVELLNETPKDILGELFTSLNIGNKHTGQFFTPSHISEFMAEISLNSLDTVIADRGFITASDPACGAGSMILGCLKVLLNKGYNPQFHLWVQCVDIDRLCALMCFLQLSLWNVPAQVIVGNSLTMETREVFYTPAHYLGCWNSRLNNRLPTDNDDIAMAQSPNQMHFDF